MQDELFKKTKRKKYKFIVTAVILVLFGFMAFFTMRIIAPDHAENKVKKAVKGNDISVTLEINCKSLSRDMTQLKNRDIKEYIPKNGYFLKKKEYKIKKNSTVYDIFKAACREKKIPFIKEQKTGYSGVYVSSIGHLAEFDAGRNSGWMYSVNGEIPNLSASEYKLKNKDKIVWYYVINYKNEM